MNINDDGALSAPPARKEHFLNTILDGPSVDIKKGKFIMSLKKRIAAMAAALVMTVGAVGALGAADAEALVRIPDANCVNHSDYWITYSTTGNTCWAENGYISVTLYSVAQVSAGNNSGLFIANAQVYNLSSYKYQAFSAPYPTVSYIQITGR
ncbi:MAG: hypothetical protein FWF43_08925 [Propionibacteriaceae bacterium]|nr:hypothetical protein [Propionibacteriaceae bacterium]